MAYTFAPSACYISLDFTTDNEPQSDTVTTVISLPVRVRGANPGTNQQQVGDRDADSGQHEGQEKHAENQFAKLGLRVRKDVLRPAADHVEPDERRSGDDEVMIIHDGSVAVSNQFTIYDNSPSE